MSMRLVKESSKVILPNDETILSLKVTSSGKIDLQAPMIHPKDVCKLLNNLAIDIMYQAIESKEVSKIQT